MMLHRHFENQRQRENMTTLADVTPSRKQEEFVSEIFPPDDAAETVNDEPKRRGRPRKAIAE